MAEVTLKAHSQKVFKIRSHAADNKAGHGYPLCRETGKR
jgi:hypothetical protein